MNALTSTWRLLFLFCLGAFGLMARAEEPAAPEQARLKAAVTRSIGFLDKEGEAWMNSKDCNGCHHMPELVWSLREARRRGVAVEQTRYDEVVEWALAREKKPVGGPEVSAFLKLALPERPSPELTKLIVAGQQADGSWKPGGQFSDMQRRTALDATENSARVFLLALATQAEEEPATAAARTKATALLDRKSPPTTVDTLVYRLLFARRFGPPDEVAQVRAELLKQQQPDGGFAYMLGETQSDALATGEALYALQQEPATEAAEPIARAQSWLLERQREDGGWAIDITKISKIDRSAPAKAKSFKDATGIYTFWGSAWATIGLLQGLPVAEPPVKASPP